MMSNRKPENIQILSMVFETGMKNISFIVWGERKSGFCICIYLKGGSNQK